MGKSAEVVEGKGVAGVHWVQRVRNVLITNGLDVGNICRLEGLKVECYEKKDKGAEKKGESQRYRGTWGNGRAGSEES